MDPRDRRIIWKRAAFWAGLGSLIGVTIWSVVGGPLWFFYYNAASAEALQTIPLVIAGSAVWAAVIGAVAAPIYFVVFAVWQHLARRWPALEASAMHRNLATLSVAVPPAMMLAYGFASGIGFDWGMASRVFPIALLSFWGGVWLPRRLIASLRGPFGVAAAQRPLQLTSAA